MVAKRLHFLVGNCILKHVLLDLAESEQCLAAMPMLARLLGDEKVNANFSFNVITGHVRRQEVDCVPLKIAVPHLRDFRFVDRLPLLASDLLVN